MVEMISRNFNNNKAIPTQGILQSQKKTKKLQLQREQTQQKYQMSNKSIGYKCS